MQTWDWIVLVAALFAIVAYGMYKSKNIKDMNGYLLAGKSMRWYTILLSIMATQASAITFLSTPGQAYVDGVRFVQFYLGLPLAMIVLSITAVPLYHRLKVYTAYEYLESRFDLKTRGLAALLFLIQRGLAAGLTIYAPSIILSVLLGWNIYWTNLIVGVLVILYTTAGGARAVNWTQFQQMLVIFFGMVAAFIVVIHLLPEEVSLLDAAAIAGKMGKLNAIDFHFDLNNRYTFWSGILGGFFLQLSYFGTDQSQVQRYLTARSITHSRLALLFNGIVKIPMQFSILILGALVFVFYQFHTPPLFFNPVEAQKVKSGIHAARYEELEKRYDAIFEEKRAHLTGVLEASETDPSPGKKYSEERLKKLEAQARAIREEAIGLIQATDPGSNTSDTNYIFLTFVINFLPVGLVGLVIAAILSASMSSTSAELNALASTTVVDVYRRLIKKDASQKHYVIFSKIATLVWGAYAIFLAEYASRLGSLIEAVNILGSIFYGTILGIFLVAFYLKWVKGSATFFAALLAELLVLYCFIFTDISFLWYNVIGCFGVILWSLLLNPFFTRQPARSNRG